MIRVIMYNRVLKFSKPKFWLATQSSSSSRCFNSLAQSPHTHITNTILTSPLRQNVFNQSHPLQNRSFVQWRRSVSSHAQMANDDHRHQSMRIESFDAFCKEGKFKEAIEVIETLENEGYVVDLPRILGLAKLCGEAEALEEAKLVNDFITPLDVSTYHTLIEMYSGCGSSNDALNVFDEMPERTSETWCVMMRCLANNGKGELALDMFTSFKEEGNIPDKEMFKAVISACVSLGDVNEGLLHFEAMYRDYGIIPSMEDYVSVTEMLAACGHIDEAVEFVERMTVEPSFEVWETLMNLCWVHGDLELGDRFAELAKKLDATRMNKESNAGLVAAKASDSAKEKLKQMRRRRMTIHERMNASPPEFKEGDTSHPEFDKIVAALRSLRVQMLDMGFVPATRVCYETVEEEEKEEQLLLGCNKLAVAYELLKSHARQVVSVLKHMHTCVDSHNTFKMISEITGRTLIQRDEKRFHHYRNGVCSCKDYW